MEQKEIYFIVVLFMAMATLSPVKCSPSPATTYTKDEKEEFVKIHNMLREAANPSASKMNLIDWDYELERLALKAATRCDKEHSYGKEYAILGENIFSSASHDPFRATVAWYTEKSAFDPIAKTCDPTPGVQCGHFLQVVGDTTNKIGCAYNTHENCTTVYCLYTPYAQYYTTGPHCSQCPADMPFCTSNGLCAESSATANCKIGCNATYCGKRVLSHKNCTCDCGPGTMGHLCAKQVGPTASFTRTCSACTDSPACLNGGTEDTSNQEKCKCTCKPEFVGERCETAKVEFDNSVKLLIRTGEKFLIQKVHGYPPISKLMFTDKIWSILQKELANIIESFCKKDATNFGLCCPGKTFPGAVDAASKSHVKVQDLKFIEKSVYSTFDGSLTFLVYAKNTGNTLCADGAATSYVLPSVLRSAIEPNKNKITKALLNQVVSAQRCCYNNITLREVTSATYEDLAFPQEVSGSKSSEPLRTMSGLLIVVSISLSLWLHLLVI